MLQVSFILNENITIQLQIARRESAGDQPFVTFAKQYLSAHGCCKPYGFGLTSAPERFSGSFQQATLLRHIAEVVFPLAFLSVAM